MSLSSCFHHTKNSEGIRSFYRGLASPLLTTSMLKSSAFTIYEITKSLLNGNNADNQPSLGIVFISGATAGAFVSLISSPLDMIKVQMQMPNSKNLYTHSFDCLSKLVFNGGYKRMYQGLQGMLIRESVGFGTYFLSYETLCRASSPTGNKKDISILTKFLCGGCSGIILWCVIYPLDLIKTRLQTQTISQRLSYSGWIDCARKSYSKDGILGFYRGISASLLRAFPVHSSVFVVYELCLNIF